jgi:hypothetical protein
MVNREEAKVRTLLEKLEFDRVSRSAIHSEGSRSIQASRFVVQRSRKNIIGLAKRMLKKESTYRLSLDIMWSTSLVPSGQRWALVRILLNRCKGRRLPREESRRRASQPRAYQCHQSTSDDSVGRLPASTLRNILQEDVMREASTGYR